MRSNAREAVVMIAGDGHVAINCSLILGVPPPQFKWERHGEDISNLGNGNYEQRNCGNLESSLVFKTVRLEDEAEYACIASNFRGSVRKEFSVRVRQPSRAA